MIHHLITKVLNFQVGNITVFQYNFPDFLKHGGPSASKAVIPGECSLEVWCHGARLKY